MKQLTKLLVFVLEIYRLLNTIFLTYHLLQHVQASE